MVWTGGNGAWETASNWSNGLPTSTSTVTFNDSAAISGYSVGLDATETVANVMFSATTKGVFWTVSNDYASNLWNVTSNFVLDQSSAATALATFRNGIIAVTNNAGTATFSVGNYADGGKGLFTMTFKNTAGDTTTTNYPTLIINDFLVTSNSTFTLNAGTLTTYGGSIDRGTNATLVSFAPSAGAIATWNILGGTNSITYVGVGGTNEFAFATGGTLNVNVSGATTKAIWGGANTDVGWNGAADVTVSGGAVLTNSGNAFLSRNGLSSTNNTVTVTGAGSRWTVGNQLEFGAAAGSNSLTVAAGGVVSSFSSLIGQGAAASNNLVTVTGGNSTWTNTDLVVLGVNAGGNTLIITNSGQFNSSTDSNNYTRLGGSVNSGNNQAIVDGSGSVWNNGGQLQLGSNGVNNTVIIKNGGEMTGTAALIGMGASSSNNAATVNGAGSEWTSSGGITVGVSGSANQMIVSNSGEVITTGLTLSSGASSNNTVLVSGGILIVTNATTNAVLNVGSAGQGSVTFTGGTVVVDDLVVTNTIIGSILNTNQFIFNSGVLTNRAGSTVSNGLLFVVGDSVDAATLNLLGGTNTFATGLEVTNNGALVINRLAAGHSPTVTMGQLLVTSNATLTIQSGMLTTLTGATIGRGTNATFDIAPVGGDSVTWNIQGGTNAITYLGTVGTNRLALTTGGTVTVNVSGATTRATLGGAETDIGWNGAVGVTVSGGAVLTNSGNAFLSRNGLSSTNNTVTVTGAGSQWNIGGELQVGAAGPSNSMTISAGGEVSSTAGRLGSGSSSSNNLVMVTGTNSLWQTSGILGIGEQANAGNSLIISNGGEVLNLGTITRMGLNTNGNNNSLIVDGAGSQMVFTNNSMVVGNFGLSNNVTVKNEGAINGGAVIVGDGAGSSFNTILVTGTNSSWKANTGMFQVGLGGSGNQMIVSNGAQVSAMGDGGLQISTGATSNNSVLVSGGILVVTNAAANAVLNVGSAGAGTFAFNGGSVTANQLLLTNGAGSVFVFNSGTLTTDSAFVTNNAPVIVGNGVAAAQWNMQGGEHSLASGLGVSALGVVAVNAGTLDVSGAVSNSGTLSMINSVAHFSGPVINSGAWITDPTTNTFANTYTATPSGYIAASAGDVYEFQKSFVNQSTRSNNWNTLNVTPGSSGSPGTTFIFDGNGATGTQQFFQAGLQLTGGFNGSPVPSSNGVQLVSSFGAVSGFETNFALGTLDIGNADTNSIVMLSSSFSSGSVTGALFVNDLDLYGTSELIISNNMELYFVSSNDWSMSNIELLGNGGIHQLQEGQAAVVPEPGVLLLWVCGAGVVYAARRRTGKRAARPS
jgi:T5SS/PEP-CTERM-associated repeat protein